MNGNQKENNQQKHQFRSYYCLGCRQKKPCGLLTEGDSKGKDYCCPCYFQNQLERNQGNSSYEETLARQQIDQEKRLRQLQLLKSYGGCSECGSLQVDAGSLWEETRLVCQPCLARERGWTTSPISFGGQSQGYRKYWRINLSEWLENFLRLPVNKNCAERWLRDKSHLDNCQCLVQEAREIYLLINDNLTNLSERLKDCSCESSPKIRVESDSGAWCERCEKSIRVASKKRVIKNRNDPRFWGLSVEEKVLCGDCLEEEKGQMTPLRRAKFNEYLRLGRL